MSPLRWRLKGFVIGVLSLVLLVPLALVQSTVAERQRYRAEAVASVMQSYAGAQTLLAPVVVVPYRLRITVSRQDERGVPYPVQKEIDRHWTFFPRDAAFDGQLLPDIKRRGIHEVRVYELAGSVQGRFDLRLPTGDPDGEIVSVGAPVLGIGIDDVRGLVGSPTLQVDGQPVALAQGTQLPATASGLHATLAPLPAGQTRSFAFRFDLRLGGSERFAYVPLADANRIALRSPWPHPDFDGRFSPRQPRISSAGFAANWDISSLASGAQAQFLAGAAREGAPLDAVAVSLVEPVNIYSQADRASKYGFLFVALTFTGFFLFELVKRLAIHPIQYTLVGLALAIFFLLLLSLSEHVAFWLAYLLSSGACIGLLALYLAGVLRSPRRGAAFAGMLTLLYGALYGLLVSEDNALVLGALLLFAILAAVMLGTRRIDWYTVGGEVAGSE